MKDSKVFFDTNVLIYVFDKSAKRKADRATELIDSMTQKGRAVLSMQVVWKALSARELWQPKPLLKNPNPPLKASDLKNRPVCEMDSSCVPLQIKL